MSVPGWYPDPHGAPGLRYWSGTQWTGHFNPFPPGYPTGNPPPQPTAPAWPQPPTRPAPVSQLPGWNQQPHQPSGWGQPPAARLPQRGSPQPAAKRNATAASPGNNTVAWVTFAVLVGAIITVSIWLLFFRGENQPASTPPPTVAVAGLGDETNELLPATDAKLLDSGPVGSDHITRATFGDQDVYRLTTLVAQARS